MHPRRADRIGALIKQELAAALTQRLRDPRIGFVTVTDVKVSDDMKNAKVFYSVMGSNIQKEETATGLEKARGFLQRDIANALKLRFTPHLTFWLDPSIDEGLKIDTIIREIHSEG